MKNLLIIFVLACLRFTAQNVEWVSVLGGATTQTFTESGEHICFDNNNNILLSSYFEGQNCTTNGSLIVSSGSSYMNGLSYMTDINGNYINHVHIFNADLWHQNVLNNGDTYGCGTFYINTQFGNISLIDSSSLFGGFVYKKSVNGNYIWAKKFGGAGDASIAVRASAIDVSGNVYVTGMFCGTVNFGGIIKTANVFNSSGPYEWRNYDGYIIKYDPNGNLIWVKVLTGPAGDRIESIKSDLNGSIYVTGSFEGGPNAPFQTDFFGGHQANTTGPATSFDLFVAKLKEDGTVKWVRTGGGNYNDYGEAVEVDQNGNVFVGGDYTAKAFFSGQQTDSVNFTLNFLLNKYDSIGNLVWIRTGSGSGYDVARGLKMSNDGNVIYATGVVSDGAVFGNDTVSGYGGQDILFASYTTSGNLLELFAMGSAGNDRGHYVNVHPQTGDLFLTGYCEGGAQFGMQTTSGYGGPDIFLAKLKAPVYERTKEETSDAKSILIYPVPTHDILNILNPVKAEVIEVYNSSGSLVLTQNLNGDYTQINIASLNDGLYCIKLIRNETHICQKRFIKK
ncbi:MAG: hypothetical protein K0S32_3107 [Bacteroidetes bacterium]|jgi:hypothetical protein|nr:hypothetical protein [Bacteroidota bacterium]